MKKRLKNSYKAVGVVLLVIFVLSSTYFLVLYYYKVKPLFKPKEYINLLSFKPDIKEQPIGNPNAPITITAYVGLTTDAGRFYHKEIFPFIYQNYINTGIVRYYPKPFLLEEDLKQKSKEYNISLSLICNQKEFLYYLSNGVDSNDFNLEINTSTCDSKAFEEEVQKNLFYGIIIEPTLFIGINGEENTVISGIPSKERIRGEIRQKLILLGKA